MHKNRSRLWFRLRTRGSFNSCTPFLFIILFIYFIYFTYFIYFIYFDLHIRWFHMFYLVYSIHNIYFKSVHPGEGISCISALFSPSRSSKEFRSFFLIQNVKFSFHCSPFGVFFFLFMWPFKSQKMDAVDWFWLTSDCLFHIGPVLPWGWSDFTVTPPPASARSSDLLRMFTQLTRVGWCL